MRSLSQEQARWDELKAQRLALTPERPPAAAAGPLDDATPGAPAEAVAAARQEAHQQLTLQVGFGGTLCRLWGFSGTLWRPWGQALSQHSCSDC